ncbi:HD domain-containing protein, partial [Pseudomonas aeruginosa]|uniref:HD domain-containing protein n=1 Tax=Pseudomonas aeruginosa TaxID=287 RepID=UPI0020D0ECA0
VVHDLGEAIHGDIPAVEQAAHPDKGEQERADLLQLTRHLDTPHGKESYYQVLIKTDGSQLKRGEEVLPIIPGMVAEVDILSGK